MALTKKDVEKLAGLARIQLSNDEKEKFSEQISSILDYVKQIEEVDTSRAVIADHHGRLTNVFRADQADPYPAAKKIIDQFPEKYGNLNKVKRVFE